MAVHEDVGDGQELCRVVQVRLRSILEVKECPVSLDATEAPLVHDARGRHA